MIWLPASSNGGIDDAASVSVNVMDRRAGRRRRSRNSSKATLDERRAQKARLSFFYSLVQEPEAITESVFNMMARAITHKH